MLKTRDAFSVGACSNGYGKEDDKSPKRALDFDFGANPCENGNSRAKQAAVRSLPNLIAKTSLPLQSSAVTTILLGSSLLHSSANFSFDGLFDGDLRTLDPTSQRRSFNFDDDARDDAFNVTSKSDLFIL